MLVTKQSMLTGNICTKELPITEAQIKAYNDGAHVQDAFPDLPAADREFIFSGITAEEWDATFGDEEDEKEDPNDCSD